MSEPEIARRCPTCGASIREVALFCPQCGNPQPPRQPRTSVKPETTSTNTAPLEGTAQPSPPQSMSDTIAIERIEDYSGTGDDGRSISDTMVIERPDLTATAPLRPGIRGSVGAKIQRATTLARDVEGDVLHRVQKVRDVSSVVLDEAGSDPGLRFVLVAVVIFVLFLVIVLLNKLIP